MGTWTEKLAASIYERVEAGIGLSAESIADMIENHVDEHGSIAYVSPEPEDRIGSCVLAIREAAAEIRDQAIDCDGWPGHVADAGPIAVSVSEVNRLALGSLLRQRVG